MRAIGLMSGTSMDGIDVAMIETDGLGTVHCGPAMEYAYPPAFRAQITDALHEARSILDRTARPGSLLALEQSLTSRHVEAVNSFLAQTNIEVSSIDVIGFHGQTVLHRPDIGVTVQLGDGQQLADTLQVPVVYDLRANDMANGGQGAPLVPVYHAALAAQLDESVAFVNIGGISNVTFVSKGHDPVAFDTGPGNALIDQWVQQNAGIPYDEGGRIASEGAVHNDILARCLAMPFFAKGPPKSLDRNDFSPTLVAGLELSDGARTLAAITAHSIFAARVHAPDQPKTWILCGGGRKNLILMNHLAELAHKQGARVVVAEEVGFDGGAMEAQAWAYLAVRSLKGLPISFPQTTGVKSPTTGGVLAVPRSV
jgi:anhydro-N-acetylmuramic acid kinase